MTERITPTFADIHAILARSLKNSKAIGESHQQRAGVLMDDLSDAGLCVTRMAQPKPDDTTEHTTPSDWPASRTVFNKGDRVEYAGCFTEGRTGVLLTSANAVDAPDTTVLVNWDNGGQECVRIGALRNVTPAPDGEPTVQAMVTDAEGISHEISLPCSLGPDQEAREGLERELWVADVDTTTEPRRVAIDYTGEHGTSPRELGWFDVRTMVRQLAQFAPDLAVVRREDLPEVTITEHMTEPTTCTVDIGGVRRFSGADWSHHSTDAMFLRNQLTEARMKLATAEGTIEHQRGRIQTITDAIRRKNSDIERYAKERREAIEARKASENAQSSVTAQGQKINELQEKVRKLTEHARKWQRFAAVLELMEDATEAELIIDGVRIKATKP